MKMGQVGDEVEVLSTDKGSATEIPEWIRKVKHDLLDTREENGVWHVIVRKAK
jgi:TusA-related sulfurtransferase